MGIGTHERRIWIYDSDFTPDDLNATGDAGQIMDVVQPITVLRVGSLITTVMNGPATVAFDRRVLTSSDSGRVAGLDGTNGIVIIPTTTAVGKMVYKDVRVDLNPGDQVVPEVTSGATSGAARHFVEYLVRDETALNCSDMVASA